MNALIYYITVPFIYLISILPFWMMYLISDFLYLVVYRVFGFRKKVVITNLKNCYTDKSEKEIEQITKRFYSYFCDLILETIKTITISEKTTRKRLSVKNIEVLEKYHEQNQSILIVMGHWGNWELAGARFAIEPLHKLYVIYHPLKNKYFDRLIYHMRTRLGNGLYSMRETSRGMIENQNNLTATAFIADQTPSPKNCHWTKFLNQDTPVFRGVGKYSKKFEYPVVYIGVKRTKRGYYEIMAEDLVPDPNKVEETEILELFTKRLERDINELPETWLWTHRRWKHTKQS